MTEREELFHIATHSNNPAWRWLPNNAEMLRFVDYLLANGVTIQKWIPVEERLPKPKELVLCRWRKVGYGGVYGFATYQHDDVWYVSNEGMPEVTHWMPLPDRPKEET